MENVESKPDNGPVTKVTRTGVFKGEWPEVCQFCGEEQSAHRMTWGPVDGELFEHRLPCQPENDKMVAEQVRMVRTAKAIVLVRWVAVPLLILLIKKFTVIGWVAFAASLVTLEWKVVKIYGNPENWFPAYGRRQKEKRDKERLHQHYIYHCERNPEGFERLRVENFRQDAEEKDKSGN